MRTRLGSPRPITLLLAALAAFAATPALPARPGDAGYDVVTKATLRPSDPVPAPKGPVVLTVSGAARNGGKPVVFDIAGLERLGTVRYRSKNQWYDGPVTYEGVLGSDLLDFLGVPAGKTRLMMRALNEYVVRVPVDDLRRWPVLFALKLDGAYMPVREKGPIWLVYPNHLHPELGGGLYQDRWIWQLKEIAFEP